MNKKQIIGLALLAGLALTLGACGKAATSTVADAYTAGEQLGGGTDQSVGVVNTGLDVNMGALNLAATDNVDGIAVVGATGFRKADGSCITDTDKDGLCNEEDPDIDGDGIMNANDDDIDGDGILNVNDNDIDGDGILNINDNDIDGDGIANVNDSDIDGDGIANVMDPDIDGDGILNVNDNDIDGDGILNTVDPDIDGDGILNAVDPDVDGDGILNVNDPDINGDGIVDNVNGVVDFGTVAVVGAPEIIIQVANQIGGATNSEGTLVLFSNSGLLDVNITSAIAGEGSHTLLFQDVRDSAIAKNADVSTINPYDIQVTLLAASLTNYDPTTALRMKIYYQLPGEAKTLLGMTSATDKKTLADLVNGVSMSAGSLQSTENYAVFQTMMADITKTQAVLTVEFSDVVGTLPVGVAVVSYVIKANAKVKV